MRCPVCKIGSMRALASGKRRIDRCHSCGGAWFDPGEILELTEGRFPEAGELPADDDVPPAGKEGVSARMAAAWKQAASLSCPRCSRPLSAIDLQNTGVPVFRCRECGGLLAPRAAVRELSRRFGFYRRNAALYDALGESLAVEMRRRLELQYGAGSSREFPGDVRTPGLPVVVPLSDGAAAPAAPPSRPGGFSA
jgi:Zn-finger nucleic acid-binding protein